MLLLLLQIFIPEYDVVLERFGHSATAIPINPSLIEVAIVGGCLDLDFRRSEEEHLLLLGTIVLKFGMQPVNTIFEFDVKTMNFFRTEAR